MTRSKRLRLAISLAPLAGALALAIPAQAAPSGGSGPHFQSGGHGDFHGGFHRGFHDHDRGGFGFGFGFWDPWWGWDWGYPYYYPYDYPPYPAYYPPPAGPAPQGPVQPTGVPPQQFWYYCDNPQGYYPYVANCSGAWRPVAPPPQSGNTVTPKQ